MGPGKIPLTNINENRSAVKIESTPVTIICYNRPWHLQQVLQALNSYWFETVYFVCDGARDESQDKILVQQVRDIVESYSLCSKKYVISSETNMGSKYRVYTGLNDVLSREVRTIILEDDCVPAAGFIEYCSFLLEKYSDDERVYTVSGRNDVGFVKEISTTYFFYSEKMLGWGTWRRAWNKMDIELETCNENVLMEIEKFYESDKRMLDTLHAGIEQLRKGHVDAWDYQWIYTMARDKAVSILPRTNMIKNIGFDEFATHTKNKRNKIALVKSFAAEKVMVEPSELVLNHEYSLIRHRALQPVLWEKAYMQMKRTLRGVFRNSA